MNDVYVTLNDKHHSMNNLVFGHFIEYMRDCIDGGMWAQILHNRGFDKRKDIPEGTVDGNPEVAEGWIRTGYNNSFQISLDRRESIARDGYSQHINCFNACDGYVGVGQKISHLYKGKHQGYIWGKSSGIGSVFVRLSTEDGETLYRENFQFNDNWEQRTFSFLLEQDLTNALFEIAIEDESDVWLDGVSLMRADCICGLWKDVYHAIKDLHPPIIRYPGGCFADCYHFEDGIGDIDTRPYRRNLHWGGFTDNSLGTDEYVMLCRSLGAEPMICVNFGSGSAEEAAAWVEYCNGDLSTYWGRKRAANGHKDPYNVKYWDIGNETFGDWEIGHTTAAEYCEKLGKFASAMKAKDPSIQILACGGDGDDRSQNWNEVLRKHASEYIDLLGLHMYAMKLLQPKHYDNTAIYYSVVGAVKKYEEILLESFFVMNNGAQHRIPISISEYNVGTNIDSGKEQTLETAVFIGGMLNMFIRYSDILALCNYSDLVNGWPGGCIVSRDGIVVRTANYYVLQLYAEANLKEVCGFNAVSDSYSTNEIIGNIEPLSDVPYVDIAGGYDEGGRLVIFVVNRNLSEEAVVSLKPVIEHYGAVGGAEIVTIFSEKTSDHNDWKCERISPHHWCAVLEGGQVTLKPHSVNRITLSR